VDRLQSVVNVNGVRRGGNPVTQGLRVGPLRVWGTIVYRGQKGDWDGPSEESRKKHVKRRHQKDQREQPKRAGSVVGQLNQGHHQKKRGYWT